MNFYKLLLIVGILISFGCKQSQDIDNDEVVETQKNSGTVTFANVHIPEDFKFNTMKSVNIEIFVNDLKGNPLSNAEIVVFSKLKTIYGGPTPDTVIAIPFNMEANGYTDKNGKYTESVTLPDAQDLVYVQAGIFGIDNVIATSITNDRISLTFNEQANQ